MGATRTAFFASLERQPRTPLPLWVRGTLRIDLVAEGFTEHWFVDMTTDRLSVRRENRPADSVLTTSPELFDRLVAGDSSVLAALLRNESTFAGDSRLIHTFRRLFPSTPGTRDPRESARQRAPHGDAWRARLRAALDQAGRNRNEEDV